MSQFVGLKLKTGDEVIGIVAQDLGQTLPHGIVVVSRPARVMTAGKGFAVRPWARSQDPDRPTYFRAEQIASVFGPRLDVANVYARYLADAAPAPTTRLPTVSCAEICDLTRPIVVLEPDFADGNVSVFELIVIDHLVRRLAPKVCFEIGTFDGRTTLNIAANVDDDAVIHTLDLPAAGKDATAFALSEGEAKYVDKPVSGARFLGTQFAARIRRHLGDSATFDFAPFAGTVDLVFVDASHAYDYVKKDTETAFRLLRDGKGCILWHDYGVWEGVTRALEEGLAGDPRLGGLRHVAGTSLAYLAVA